MLLLLKQASSATGSFSPSAAGAEQAASTSILEDVRRTGCGYWKTTRCQAVIEPIGAEEEDWAGESSSSLTWVLLRLKAHPPAPTQCSFLEPAAAEPKAGTAFGGKARDAGQCFPGA